MTDLGVIKNYITSNFYNQPDIFDCIKILVKFSSYIEPLINEDKIDEFIQIISENDSLKEYLNLIVDNISKPNNKIDIEIKKLLENQEILSLIDICFPNCEIDISIPCAIENLNVDDAVNMYIKELEGIHYLINKRKL